VGLGDLRRNKAMDGGDLIRLGLLFVAILFSAFFSGSEAAFLSLDRGRIARLQNNGGKRASMVARLANHPEKLFPTVLTGNNLANTAAAVLGSTLATSFLNENNAIIISTVIITIILLIFAETIPKTIATKRSSSFAMGAVTSLQIIEKLLYPIVWLLQHLTATMDRVFRVSGTVVVAEEEIRALIEIGREAGEVDPAEAKLLEQVFRFGDSQLREAMTPRIEIIWVEKGTTRNTFLEIYGKNPHTRFPMYEGDFENVLGTISIKDVLFSIATEELGPEDDISILLRQPYFIPETKQVGPLFQQLRGSGYQMVMVVDEFGGIAGLATIKQMLEEIVGRFGEEGIEEEQEFQEISANIYTVDGGMDIEEANEHLKINIPKGGYKTIAGFFLLRLGRVPIEGEFIYYGGFLFEVTAMTDAKIEQFKITRVAIPFKEDSE